ncbi:MAG: DUF3857 domain-containing protein [Saprospiraceae bacterium]|nr:DUF3857 domain-containing protein [Saprospiraceae bacterium]
MFKHLFFLVLIIGNSISGYTQKRQLSSLQEIRNAFATEIPDSLKDYPAVFLINNSDHRLIPNYDRTIKVRRHFQILILSDAGKEYADVTLKNYTKKNYHKIRNIQASTYHLINGEVVEYPVKSEDLYDIENSEDVSSISFAFPQVQAGSILEYVYFEEFEDVGFPPMELLKNIPTISTEVSIQVPKTNLYSRAILRGHSLKADTLIYYSEKDNNTPNGYKTHYLKFSNIPAFETPTFFIGERDLQSSLDFQNIQYFRNYLLQLVNRADFNSLVKRRNVSSKS